MYTKERIERIASRIVCAEVKYTSKGSGDHAYRKNRDFIRVYDNPRAPKRFNMVFAGPDWESGPVKTILKVSEGGNFTYTTGREDDSLGTPVVWNSLPRNIQSVALNQIKGNY